MKKLMVIFLFFTASFWLFTSNPHAQEDLIEYEAQWEKLSAEVDVAYRSGHYLAGISLAEKAYQYALQNLGKEHPDTLVSINNLAELYRSLGRYSEAEPLLKECLKMCEKVLGKEHPDYLNFINNLAILYQLQGRYGDAEPLYKECLQLSEKLFGKEHPYTLRSINNLAELYRVQGRYSEAEPLLKECLKMCEKVLGKEHPSTLISINNLADLYNNQGRYGEAEPLFKQSLKLNEKVLGKEHPITIRFINNLAMLYEKQGRYDEAEPLFKQSLKLNEKVLGKEHPDTLMSINNLAGLYQVQGLFGDALLLLKEGLKLSQNNLGKEHPQTLTFINNLAMLYLAQEHFEDAEPFLKEVLQLREKNLGKEHPDTLLSINNLAALYDVQGRYGDVEPLLKECLQLSEKVLGKEHPDALTMQINYIVLLLNMNQPRTAFRLMKNMEALFFSRSFQELYSTTTERVRRLYLEKISVFQDLAFSFALAHPEPEHQAYAANVLLRWKQVNAEESAFQHRLLTISQAPEDLRLKEKISMLRARLGASLRNPALHGSIAATWQELTDKEGQVRDRARKFKPDLDVARTVLDQVAGYLPKGSALLEFRICNPRNFKTGKGGKAHFVAYLLMSDIGAEQQIFFEDLGEAAILLQALADSGKKPEGLYEALLGKFDDRIKDVKKLYIAPDSFLGLIPFAALRLADGKYLVQRQQVAILQTGRDLKPSSSLAEKGGGNLLVAFGGVDYGGKSPTETTKAKSDDKANLLNMRAARELDGMKYLEHSLYEANTIASLFTTHRKDGKAEVFKGKDATESKLKSLEQSPLVLHLSTHGYYLASHEDANWAAETPLLLSGLALAGANQGLRGIVDEKGEDGLLYGLEALGLNLQGTELVSLSACNTGKGVVDYSEGVYGLVQAFRAAGARNVLMTLQPVGDESSRTFMEKFYEIWLGSRENLTPSEAMHRTQLAFINHQNPEYRDSKMWSPYVLVGN